MPLPSWAIIGAVIYQRPRDHESRILRSTGAVIVYVHREEVQVSQNNVVFLYRLGSVGE